MQCEEDWGHNVCGLALGYDVNEQIDIRFILHHNGRFDCHQPFHCPTSFERLELDCNMRYIDANQGMISEDHNIWVRYGRSEENDFHNTFEGLIPSFPELYLSWIPLDQSLQFLECLPAGRAISAFSKRCKKIQQWVLHPQAQEYTVGISTQYNNLHS
jgi:hypothetical protein